MKQISLLLLALVCFTSQVLSIAVRDEETQKIREELDVFCKKNTAQRAPCEAIREKFFLAVKAKAFTKDPCGTKKAGEELANLFPGDNEAKSFAEKMAVAKGNILTDNAAGLKPIKGTQDKLGKGQDNKCTT